ncbi:AP-2 complex subunit alpha [[Candida] anglica]|uniref:AP-2 complex subunit alpha n=1 Tax=[Candida] anglica TaxID=148631 RepID=A0ABP0E7C7_9ASCO
MSKQMKGLTQFILDLRNSNDQREETKRINLEINNIQAKLKGVNSSSERGNTGASASGLSGYQKKKYVCKLVYMQLLGYADTSHLFGPEVPLQLARSNVFSEKQVGYLALSVLTNNFREKSTTLSDHLDELMDLTYSTVKKDLQSNNEYYNCLAMQFIASNFNVQVDEDVTDGPLVVEGDHYAAQWLEFIDLVYSFATSPIIAIPVKKKAVLALFVLFKLYPGVIVSNSNWVPRILSLLDDSNDLGLLTASIPLIEFVSHINPQYVKSTMAATTRRLAGLVMGPDNRGGPEVPESYYYYNCPAPWLVVKLLNLVESLFLLRDAEDTPVIQFTSLDPTTVKTLRQVVSRCIQNASQPIKGLPGRNSHSSILFQAVSLVAFLNASQEALHGATTALISLLDSHETNTRYLALDALIKLTVRSPETSSTSTYFDSDELTSKLFDLLRDKDISVKRKSLDLVYTISNGANYITVINGLLHCYPHAELQLRSDMAIKIAVLAEKFAQDSTWYVTTMLNLLSLGSNSEGRSKNQYVGNEVWERIVQIIVNNEDLHAKSCKIIVNLCNRATSEGRPFSENLVKVAGFVLGEYGHLVTELDDNTSISAEEQFSLLYESYFRVSLVTRAMLLTSFLKFVAHFPSEDFVPDIVDLFEIETQSIDLEIQTRGFEYLRLTTNSENRNLLNLVVRKFPAFDKKTSPLMTRIGSIRRLENRNRSSSFVNASKIPPATNNHLDVKRLGQSIKSTSVLSLPVTKEELEEPEDIAIDPFGEEQEEEDEAPTHAKKIVLSPNWHHGYHRMCHYDAGIFYENQFVKILYRTIKDGYHIHYKFTIINNAAKSAGTSLTGLTVLELESQAAKEDPSYLVSLESLPDSTVHEKTQFEVGVRVRNVIERNENPILSITFKSGGSFNQLKLKFPVSFLRTLTATSMVSLDEFKMRWLQIGEQLIGGTGESSTIVSTPHRSNSSNVVRLLSRLGFVVVHSTPDNLDGILVMGAGILHSQKSNYGVLVTVRSADGVGKSFELIVRCTGGGVASVISSSLVEIFEGKF